MDFGFEMANVRIFPVRLLVSIIDEALLLMASTVSSVRHVTVESMSCLRGLATSPVKIWSRRRMYSSVAESTSKQCISDSGVS